MKKHKRRQYRCENCPDCLYIGEGDYLCDNDRLDEPAIVLTEFSSPTTDYLRCRKKIIKENSQNG